jgi:hypothetical protein
MKTETPMDRLRMVAGWFLLPIMLFFWLLGNAPGELLWFLLVLSVPIGIGILIGSAF